MTDMGLKARGCLPWRSIATLLAGFIICSADSNAAPGNAQSKPRDGATLYHNYCSVCHGDKGDGLSRARGSLVPPPRDFTDPAVASRLTREYMIAVVRDGRPGTAMVGWSTQLSQAETEAVVDYVQKAFLRNALDPVLARGRAVYGHACARCHGDRGQGSSGASGHSHVPVRAFRAAKSALDRDRMLAGVLRESHGGANLSLSSRLARADAEAAVEYVHAVLLIDTPVISGTSAHGPTPRSAAKPAATDNPAARVNMALPLPQGLTGDTRRGAALYARTCATCHGPKGDGQGPRAYFIRPKPRNFLDPATRTTFNRPAVFAAVVNGKQGTEMSAWSKVLDNQQIADVSEYVFRTFIASGAPSRVSTLAR